MSKRSAPEDGFEDLRERIKEATKLMNELNNRQAEMDREKAVAAQHRADFEIWRKDFLEKHEEEMKASERSYQRKMGEMANAMALAGDGRAREPPHPHGIDGERLNAFVREWYPRFNLDRAAMRGGVRTFRPLSEGMKRRRVEDYASQRESPSFAALIDEDEEDELRKANAQLEKMGCAPFDTHEDLVGAVEGEVSFTCATCAAPVLRVLPPIPKGWAPLSQYTGSLYPGCDV